MKKLLWLIPILLVLIIGRTLRQAGVFNSIEPAGITGFRTAAPIPGAEDFALDKETGRLWISSDDRRAKVSGQNYPAGSIWLWDLDSAAAPRPVVHDFPGEFHPHGLSLWKNPTGADRLFVVNHPTGAETVEIFEIRNDSLQHVKTIKGDLIFSPNDVAAYGPEQFFVSNDHAYKSGSFERMAEQYLILKKCNLVRFDGELLSVAAEGFAYANGLIISEDGKKLFLATTTERMIHKFAIEGENKTLRAETSIELPDGHDNFAWGTDGFLYLTSHPKMLAFVGHSKDSTALSPSRIYRINPDDLAAEPVFVSDGTEISGGSIGVVYKDRLIVGSVFERKIIIGPAPGK